MSILSIKGGRHLAGSVSVQGAKNSALPILAACILARGKSFIHNCPDLRDVNAASLILKHLGCSVVRGTEGVIVDSSGITGFTIPDELMREMRSSVIFLGAILGRTGEAVLSMPGGCELGPRPIDLHLSSLRALGAEITENGGNIICKANHLKGAQIELPIPSVGATENAILAAVTADGLTTIANAAREPEITDLALYLSRLGAKISGAGTSVVKIEGATIGGETEHTVMPDRIAAATYLAAAASAGGELELLNVIPRHISTITGVLSEMGCTVRPNESSLYLMVPEHLRSARPVVTRPYPGFPTDAQPPVMAASLRAAGTTVFVENIFENRYRHVGELLRMGADIKTEGRVAIVSGVDRLHGASVKATDLRGGAALVVAALGAEGVSDISGLSHLDRGYDGLERDFLRLGADIRRHNSQK